MLAALKTTAMVPKIDAYTHFAAPELMAFLAEQTGAPPFKQLFDKIPLLDCKNSACVESRIEYMKKEGVVGQILIPLPWIEACPTVWSNPSLAARACRIANEAMAKFCSSALTSEGKRCFIGVALIPTVNEKVMMEEYKYAIDVLNLVGSALFVGPDAVPPDDVRFESLYMLSEINSSPIWLHPCRPQSHADYSRYSDNGSMHAIWNSLGWVYDTSVAMVHIALSGVLQRYPKLKIVGHHGGGMIPFFTERFAVQMSNFNSSLEQQKFDDLKRFYVDTATFGYQPMNIRQCLDFFEEGRVLFGTDTPMDMAVPGMFTRTACRSIEDLNLSESERDCIFFRNCMSFLGPHGNIFKNHQSDYGVTSESNGNDYKNSNKKAKL